MQSSSQTIHQLSSNGPTPYSADENQQHLKDLRDRLPNLCIVRTDRTKPGPHDESNPVRTTLEFANGYVVKIILADYVPRRDMERLAKKLTVNPTEFQTVLCLLKMIASNNVLGTWCLIHSEEESIVLSSRHIGDKLLVPTDYLYNTRLQLADDLIGVGEILVDSMLNPIVEGSKKVSRRSFLRFMSPDGKHEVAAIEAMIFASHARYQLLKLTDDPMQEIYQARMEHWSNQLNLTPDVMAELFGTLLFLTTTMHITRVQLR